MSSSSSDEGENTPIYKPKRPDSESSDEPRSPVEKVRYMLSDDKSNLSDVPELNQMGLFCQMDALCHWESGEYGWKESARWLKYEERVEAGDRWSKPHVATTSLHYINEVRRSLEKQCVFLDLPAPHGCLPQVTGEDSGQHAQEYMENLAKAIVEAKGFSEDMYQKILDVLLRPHKHKHREGKKPKVQRPKLKTEPPPAVKKMINRLSMRKNKPEEEVTYEPEEIKAERARKAAKRIKMRTIPSSDQEVSEIYHSYPGGVRPEHLNPHKPNKKLLRKIPAGSECANILVGQVDFLSEPIVAFVRLAKPAVLADLTEVSLPTRFIYLVLGPPHSSSIWSYEECGRAMAALLTDYVFCEVAYKATTREDLLDGVDEFKDELTVLPPSIWDPTTRLEPPEKTIQLGKVQRRLLESARYDAAPELYKMGEDETGLERTGRPFGGLIKDMKERYSLYLSDITDGLHVQCFASIIFLYFACVTPIVTFGGLLGQATDGWMGTMETMLSGAICGLLYALFAGQPLSIVGATGPLLVFESLLYSFCHDRDFPFLEFRAWIGLWVTLILLILVATDASAYVRYITRFTEESFAVLISLIFIFESFNKLAKIWDTHPIHVGAKAESEDFRCHCVLPDYMTKDNVLGWLNGTITVPPVNVVNSTVEPFSRDDWQQLVYEDCITFNDHVVVSQQCITEDMCTDRGWDLIGPACGVHTVTGAVPDVFFLSCFLFLFTFGIAYTIRSFRTSIYFPTIVRSTVSDFAVFISVMICTGIDAGLRLDTPKLMVPDTFTPTRSDRGWWVDPMNLGGKWWLGLAALLPALLATILIFLDQQITAVIVNRKDHKLKKPHGYHLDLFVLAFLIAITSLLGLPWFVAATVRAITHVRSLLRTSEVAAPGERSQFLGVREQRVTGFFIHVLIALSVLMTGILKNIPMAVLYGVFLYMGVTSLQGVQFVQRILLMLSPLKYQPDYIFLRHVRVTRVHIFTCLQIICMAIMWFFKSVKSIALLFPLMILALCFIRKGLDFAFSQKELYWLDNLLPDATLRKKEDEGYDTEKGNNHAETKFVDEVDEHTHMNGYLQETD